MKYALLCLSIMLTGCGSTVFVSPDNKVTVPKIEPLAMKDVQWKVLTTDQLKALLTKLQNAQSKNTVVFFALDTQNYNNLSLNFVDIQRYIQEQKTIIDMLKKVVDDRANLGKSSPKDTVVDSK